VDLVKDIVALHKNGYWFKVYNSGFNACLSANRVMNFDAVKL
jgi:hypothetical protein